MRSSDAAVPASLSGTYLEPDESFMRRLAGDRATLAEIAAAWPGGLNLNDLARTEVVAHKLAGAAGVFGLQALGGAAALLEAYAQELRGLWPHGAELSSVPLRDLLAALDGVLEKNPTHGNL